MISFCAPLNRGDAIACKFDCGRDRRTPQVVNDSAASLRIRSSVERAASELAVFGDDQRAGDRAADIRRGRCSGEEENCRAEHHHHRCFLSWHGRNCLSVRRANVIDHSLRADNVGARANTSLRREPGLAAGPRDRQAGSQHRKPSVVTTVASLRPMRPPLWRLRLAYLQEKTRHSSENELRCRSSVTRTQYRSRNRTTRSWPVHDFVRF